MAVVYELFRAVFGFLGEMFGLGGVAIGVLAAATVGLWYLHEVAGVLSVLARYSRTGSVLGAVVLVILTVATALGLIEWGSAGQTINRLSEVLH